MVASPFYECRDHRAQPIILPIDIGYDIYSAGEFGFGQDGQTGSLMSPVSQGGNGQHMVNTTSLSAFECGWNHARLLKICRLLSPARRFGGRKQ
jgi:hypothetical protein